MKSQELGIGRKLGSAALPSQPLDPNSQLPQVGFDGTRIEFLFRFENATPQRMSRVARQHRNDLTHEHRAGVVIIVDQMHGGARLRLATIEHGLMDVLTEKSASGGIAAFW